jgi:hypothetical protein
MRRLFGLAVIVGVAALVVGAASAAPPTAGETYSPPIQPGHGAVPTWAASMAMPWAKGGGHGNGGGGSGGGGQVFRPTAGYGQLSNHGGPVMTTNTTYAIYWQPSNWGQSFPGGYDALITRYFTDVAADKGKTTNIYYTETQYSGIHYDSAYAGSGTATAAFTNDCSDSATPNACVSDAQVQQLVSSYVTAHNLPRGLAHEYFVFFPPGLGSCLGGAGCAFVDYCAYHGSVGTDSSAIIYANQPFVENVGGCDAGHHPNGGLGDAVLNVVSHEHNESITDPFGNAWYDLFGYEDGDKCAWSWGAPTGSGSTAYNQTINGNHYMLQLEYSNADRGCVMSGL